MDAAARVEAVKAYVEWRLLGAQLVMLRNFRRAEGSVRVLADVHADHCNLSNLLAELACDAIIHP